jgi:hypothetical protein
MAYVKGDTISAADFNTFLSTAQNVYGVGSGDRGYGQTGVTQSSVTQGSTINSSHWTNLRSIVAACAAHQGTSTTLLPLSTLLQTGNTVFAHEADAPTSNAYDLNSVVAAIDTNRLTTVAGDMTLASSAHTITRASSWSTSITATFTVTWASENAARYFFNTGGELRIRLSQPTGTAQDNDWNTVLSTKVGTITFKATSASRSGSGGTMTTATGFYGLAGTESTIFDGTNIGGTLYTANDVLLYATRTGFVGANGGNGTGIQFRVLLRDDHTNVNFDTVALGAACAVDVYRCTTNITGVTAPSFSTTVAF